MGAFVIQKLSLAVRFSLGGVEPHTEAYGTRDCREAWQHSPTYLGHFATKVAFRWERRVTERCTAVASQLHRDVMQIARFT